ncbi:hypothetical protein P154DRAFT_551557 [Amniculicola lignicola CBS 123094]|uniref:Uncharacterized protein n=1 Tax=Amniculicola lignicola CBS 123094 TaxID=1392246 RepID=A0A6A5WWH4_9PLEO|nr:hypothetical protein P154DRAFT_551557 [Amniculicola lignicola CBS 123094]
MLPPVDPAIFQQNPNFEILYKDLCTRKINTDGSTRDTKKQRIHDEIRRNLTTSRTHLSTSQILLRTLSDLPSRAATLPPDLHSVIELVTAQLNGHVPPSDRPILAGDIEYFLSAIAPISIALSTQLTLLASHICKIADPIKRPNVEDLLHKAEELHRASNVDLPNDLAEEKVSLANTAYRVLDVHRQVLETAIRILEQTMHGSLARSAKAKAEYLHARASLVGVQARLHTLTHPPPSEFLAALKNYKASQGSTEAALKDREALARTALDLYEKAGEKAIQDIAKRAEYLRKEIERMNEEVEKLERGE